MERGGCCGSGRWLEQYLCFSEADFEAKEGLSFEFYDELKFRPLVKAFFSTTLVLALNPGRLNSEPSDMH